MSWKFIEGPKPGTETALDACDYFVDEVIENSGGMGAATYKAKPSTIWNLNYSICLCVLQMRARRCVR